MRNTSYDSNEYESDEYIQMRIRRAMEQFKCSEETATSYIAYRMDGYSVQVAKVMSGLADPAY